MRPKLFIALPVYAEVNALFLQCLLKLLNDPPCHIELRMNPGDSLVCRARNSLTWDFLESDCSQLLFLDTDLLFSPEHVARIMRHQEPVVGGLYPKKQDGKVAWVCNACAAETVVRPDGLQEVRYAGTGFLRVAREVFERMILAYGEQIRYTPDHAPDQLQYDFWSVGTYRYPDGFRRYLSEDWYFCQRWLDLGGKVWLDTRTVLKHVGQAVFPLRSQERELFGASHTAEPARPADVNRPASAVPETGPAPVLSVP
jgi:hypothetical protein